MHQGQVGNYTIVCLDHFYNDVREWELKTILQGF